MNCLDDIDTRAYKIEYLENCSKYSDCYLKDCIPKNTCSFLLHTLVPYYFTYLHGGDFTWSKEVGYVDVQCPNPAGKVVTDVVNNNNIYTVVKSSKKACPAKYKVGQKIDISEIFKIICPLVYDVSFPWMQLGISDLIGLRCPGCFKNKGVKFVLKFNRMRS